METEIEASANATSGLAKIVVSNMLLSGDPVGEQTSNKPFVVSVFIFSPTLSQLSGDCWFHLLSPVHLRMCRAPKISLEKSLINLVINDVQTGSGPAGKTKLQVCGSARGIHSALLSLLRRGRGTLPRIQSRAVFVALGWRQLLAHNSICAAARGDSGCRSVMKSFLRDRRATIACEHLFVRTLTEEFGVKKWFILHNDADKTRPCQPRPGRQPRGGICPTPPLPPHTAETSAFANYISRDWGSWTFACTAHLLDFRQT